MPIRRMNREEFFGQLAKLDEQRLKKALWNLYWRGSAAMRERIEAEIDPDQHGHSRHPSKEPADPEQLLAEVRDFVALARSGAYMAGDRRVSPRERSRWRLTFKRLVGDAQDGLRAQDATAAATALEQLIDLACETRHYDYFHSEDPMEAAGFVASDAVALLWARLQAQHGFAGFARRAAPQLIRWESRHGWTRSGWGRVSQKETSLASVLARMLRAPDAWAGFADRYLDGGPELEFLQAQLAYQRGDVSSARGLVQAALQRLPGHQDFLDFASEIGAPLPPRAQQIIEERSPSAGSLPPRASNRLASP